MKRQYLPRVILAIILWHCSMQLAYAQEAQINLQDNRRSLEQIEQSLDQSLQAQKGQHEDIEASRAAQEKMSQELVEATTRTQDAESRVSETEKRLMQASLEEKELHDKLLKQQNVLVEVLATLQRMSRKPPPAVLVMPEDMLRAVRAVILLGAVLPGLKSETEMLSRNLEAWIEVRRNIEQERTTLAQRIAGLKEQQDKLSSLIAKKRESQMQIMDALMKETERGQELAKKITDLKELITRMEKEEAARIPKGAVQEALPNAEMFGKLKGYLHFPVSGAIVKMWGNSDGFGGVERGVSVSVRPGAIVSSPVEGRVIFAGAYRSYGQLLILSPGSGYHIIFAGLSRVNVEVGQVIRAGEPLGSMGEGIKGSMAALALKVTQPVLYIEFRKDGIPIDSTAWWVQSELVKAQR